MEMPRDLSPHSMRDAIDKNSQAPPQALLGSTRNEVSADRDKVRQNHRICLVNIVDEAGQLMIPSILVNTA